MGRNTRNPPGQTSITESIQFITSPSSDQVYSVSVLFPLLKMQSTFIGVFFFFFSTNHILSCVSVYIVVYWTHVITVNLQQLYKNTFSICQGKSLRNFLSKNVLDYQAHYSSRRTLDSFCQKVLLKFSVEKLLAL